MATGPEPHGAKPRDKWPHRLIVLFLGTVVLLTTAGMIALAAMGQQIPATLAPVASAAVGALAACLPGHSEA